MPQAKFFVNPEYNYAFFHFSRVIRQRELLSGLSIFPASEVCFFFRKSYDTVRFFVRRGAPQQEVVIQRREASVLICERLSTCIIDAFQRFLGIRGRVCEGAGKSDGRESRERQRGDTAGNSTANVEKFLAEESPRWVTKISQSVL